MDKFLARRVGKAAEHPLHWTGRDHACSKVFARWAVDSSARLLPAAARQVSFRFGGLFSSTGAKGDVTNAGNHGILLGNE